tara:strand:+ start:1029 stop:1346 length:318 start_codon:yes stop_codon:yes gene_type:complete
MKYVLIIMLLFVGCNKPKTYECRGWDKRACMCPNGEIGVQKCSRGPAFADPPPVRTWLPCNCCFIVKKDEHGVYYINYDDTSGCWDDVYDPSVPSVEEVVEGDTD